VVLVAGSARCRKSTAIKIGTSLLNGIKAVKIYAGKTSTERFIVDQVWAPGEAGAVQPSSFVKADELAVFLTKDQQGEKLIDVLTTLFDCPDELPYRTFSRGEIILKDAFLSILAGTQPSSLARVLPDSAFGGGFASRIMFIYQPDTDRRNALPELSDAERSMGVWLKTRLEEIAEIKGEFFLTPDARASYIKWYNELECPDDDKLDGFFGRKGDHALRLCMVLRASEGPGFDIPLKHVLAAIKALDYMENLMSDAFKNVGKDEKYTNNAERCMRAIHVGAAVGHSHSYVLKKMYGYMDAQQFRILIETLMESGMIERNPDAPRYYRCLCNACLALRGT
jgi:hypothetical protein